MTTIRSRTDGTPLTEVQVHVSPHVKQPNTSQSHEGSSSSVTDAVSLHPQGKVTSPSMHLHDPEWQLIGQATIDKSTHPIRIEGRDFQLVSENVKMTVSGAGRLDVEDGRVCFHSQGGSLEVNEKGRTTHLNGDQYRVQTSGAPLEKGAWQEGLILTPDGPIMMDVPPHFSLKEGDQIALAPVIWWLVVPGAIALSGCQAPNTVESPVKPTPTQPPIKPVSAPRPVEPVPIPEVREPEGSRNGLLPEVRVIDNRDRVKALINSSGLYQTAEEKKLVIEAWDVLKQAWKSAPATYKKTFGDMMKLIQSGQIKFVQDDAHLKDNSALGTYSSRKNRVTLPSDWNPSRIKDQGVLIHEMKHALDDHRLFEKKIDPDLAIEGGLGLSEIDDPLPHTKDPATQKELRLKYKSALYSVESQPSVSTETAAFQVEYEFFLLKAGINPRNEALRKELTSSDSAVRQTAVTKIVDKLVKAGFFKDDTGANAVKAGYGYVLAALRYYNLPKSTDFFFSLPENPSKYKITVGGENLTQWVENVYSKRKKNGPQYVGGGQFSLQSVKGIIDVTAAAEAFWAERVGVRDVH